jgi:acetoin utilization deacetylase AcuC-like enzyme
VDGVSLEAPAPAAVADVEAVHAPEYVAAIRDGEPDGVASSSGLAWCESMLGSVLASTGGMVAAVTRAARSGVAGSLSSGMHHARRSHGLGFCTFNGLVVAARAAEALGYERILILDLDAHGGGGTASLISGNVRISHLDLVVDPFDVHEDSIDLSRRSPLDYLTVLSASLEALRPDFVIYNAGMDVAEGDCGPGGFDSRIIAAREVTVFEWAQRIGVPICYGLAGGYESPTRSRESLVAHHRSTIRAAERICG